VEHELDNSQPLVLLIGSLHSEGVLSSLKATGRQFKIKRLESTPENWDTICQLFEEFEIRCALVKLTGTTYEHLANPAYAAARDRLLGQLSRVPHAVFIYEGLFSSAGKTEDSSPEPSDSASSEHPDHDYEMFGELPFHEPEVDVRRTVDDLLIKHGINVLPYRRNAELTVMASTFIADTEEGLLFRVYIPSGRMWSNETDRLLQLFRDYLMRVGHLSVRLDQQRTERGTIYEFFRSTSNKSSEITKEQSQAAPSSGKPQEQSLSSQFQDFSHLLDLCVSDPDQAEALLRSKDVDAREVTSILTRYSKEARRLHVDIKHEREQKVLAIRQRLESELVDSLPATTAEQTIATLVEAAVPSPLGLGSTLTGSQQVLQVSTMTGGSITVNVKPQIVQAINSVIAQEIEGNVHLNEMDRQLLQLISDNAGARASELTSAVRELADESAPQPRRLVAMQRLKGFLHHVAAKVGEVGFGILQTYLEKKLGL
jgi:hypothetical protein